MSEKRVNSIYNAYPGLEGTGHFRAPRDPVPLVVSFPYEKLLIQRSESQYENVLALFFKSDSNEERAYAFCYFGTTAVSAQGLVARTKSYEELLQVRVRLHATLYWCTAQEMVNWLEQTMLWEQEPFFVGEAIDYFERKGVYSASIKAMIADMTLLHRPDYDLKACLHYNKPSYDYSLRDIASVVAEIPGGNDEFNWCWLLLLKDGRYVYLSGWCDYTGWDCQSGIVEYPPMGNVTEAVRCAPEEEEYSGRAIRANLTAQVAKKQAYGTYNMALENAP